jgi:hypothetical protein
MGLSDVYEKWLGLGHPTKDKRKGPALGSYKGRKYYKKPKTIIGKAKKHLTDVADIAKVVATGQHLPGYQAGLGANNERPGDTETVYADKNQAAASLHDEGQQSDTYFKYDPANDKHLHNMDSSTIHSAAGKALGYIKKNFLYTTRSVFFLKNLFFLLF